MQHLKSKLWAGVLAAILLAGAAAARAAPATLTLNEARGGSLLFATEAPGRHVAAPLLASETEISISGPVARVRVRQSFINPAKSWLEARYVFPLPETAAVDRMVLTSGDTQIVANIKERTAAREIFKTAKREGRRAALIEQHRPNVFATSVANIGPMASVTVEISYFQRVRFDQGSFRLRYPMVVAPRYTPPKGVQTVAAGEPLAETWTAAPVRHPDDGPANPVRLTVRLDAGVPLAALESRHHPINAEGWRDGDTVVTLKDGPVPADRDFELVWTPVAGARPATA
ncbi:MAG: VIT domain-containing protein, partial [Alphaproteobacteria bacterium]